MRFGWPVDQKTWRLSAKGGFESVVPDAFGLKTRAMNERASVLALKQKRLAPWRLPAVQSNCQIFCVLPSNSESIWGNSWAV